MADYVDLYDAAMAIDDTLHRKVAYAIKKAAYDISVESSGTANHAERLQWSRNVTLTNDAPGKWAKKMIWRVLDNATIAATVTNGGATTATDNDVQFTVNSLVDEFALG